MIGRGGARAAGGKRRGPVRCRPEGAGAPLPLPGSLPVAPVAPAGPLLAPFTPPAFPQPSAARSRLAAPNPLVQWRRRSPQLGRDGAGQRRPLSRGARAHLGSTTNQSAAYMPRVGGPAESGAAIGWARRGERFESAAAAGAERGRGDGAAPGHPRDIPGTAPQVCAGVCGCESEREDSPLSVRSPG